MTTCLGKSCSFWFTVCVFHERLSIYGRAFSPSGFEGGMWDLVILAPDLRISFYSFSQTVVTHVD